MMEAQKYVVVQRNRIAFDPMALPGCPYCGAIETATSPEGRQYTRPPFGCCLARLVHKASIAASYLEEHKKVPPWLEKKGREDELHEWHQTRNAFQVEQRKAEAAIAAHLASAPTPGPDVARVADLLKGNAYKVSIVARLVARYAAE